MSHGATGAGCGWRPQRSRRRAVLLPSGAPRQTEEEVEEAYDEHLDAKKIIVGAMNNPDAPGFDGKVAALNGGIEHHVEEEESELFPEVRKLMTAEALEALAQLMDTEANRMMEEGAPASDDRSEDGGAASSTVAGAAEVTCTARHRFVQLSVRRRPIRSASSKWIVRPSSIRTNATPAVEISKAPRTQRRSSSKKTST